MQTIIITKKDLDKDNKYNKGFIGYYDNFENVNVEIDENLHYVVFEKGNLRRLLNPENKFFSCKYVLMLDEQFTTFKM